MQNDFNIGLSLASLACNNIPNEMKQMHHKTYSFHRMPFTLLTILARKLEAVQIEESGRTGSMEAFTATGVTWNHDFLQKISRIPFR